MHDGLRSTSELRVAAAYRTGLRGLAKAVVIITCRDHQRRYAMAATAVCELSMDPPSMLICVARSASMFPALEAGSDFGVNILRADHKEISVHCSGLSKGEQRFDRGDWGDLAARGSDVK